MLKSTELRWFYPGTLPNAIAQWFHHLGAPTPTETRTDQYLLIPNCEYLGIKIRQNRLEIKCRKTELGTLQSSPHWTGQAEQWVKWTCEDPETETLIPPHLLAQNPWIEVYKQRSQRKYQTSPDQTVTEISLDTQSEQGCNLEITQLQVQDYIGWSLALEAWGVDNQLQNTLQTVAQWVSQTYQGPDLQSQASYAYPHWLVSCVYLKESD